MNYYSIVPTGTKTRAELKALFLLYLTSDDFDVTYSGVSTAFNPTLAKTVPDEEEVSTGGFPQFTANGHLPYALSNIVTNDDQVFNPVYCTEYQNVFEGFDKPIVETGDLVMCVTAPTEDMGQFYDDFITLKLGWEVKSESGLSRPAGYNKIWLGVSNSSKSDFHTPFAGASNVIVMSQQNLEEIQAKINAINS